MAQAFYESESMTLILLSLALLRIYLEFVKFDFKTLPLTQKLNNQQGQRVHKFGFYCSIGYFILFAPTYFFT